MAKKLGNDYRLWVSDDGGTTYAEVKGQTSTKISRSADSIDTSTKDDFPYGTEAPGLKKLTIDFQNYPNLPDPDGFGTLETAATSSTGAPINIQIRKGGSAGAAGDVVFAASMYITSFDTDYPKNGVVTCDAKFSLAASPTVDTLA